MIISCERCSAQYTLDDRLLSPTGSPVQCTKCGHVFRAVPQSSSTQIFGATPAVAASTSSESFADRSSKTQIFGIGDLRPPADRVPNGQPPPPAAPPPPSPAAPPPSRTQMFGIPHEAIQQALAAAPTASAPPPDELSFQAVSPAMPEGVGLASSGQPSEGSPPGPARSTTQIFGKLPAQALAWGAVPQGPAKVPDEPVALPPLPRSQPVRARPGAGPLPGERERWVVSQAALPSVRSGSSWLSVVLLGVGLGLVLAGLSWAILRRHQAPPEALAVADSALSLLRLDDPDSKGKAIEQLSRLDLKYSSFLEAKADLVLALALSLDDLRAELSWIDASSEDLKSQEASLEQRKVPADWLSRINALKEVEASIQTRRGPLLKKISAGQRKIDDRFTEIEAQEGHAGGRDRQAIVRALAIGYAVAGDRRALAVRDRYQQLGAQDGWGEVAYAEYMLNSKLAGRSDQLSAKSGLEAVTARDSTFLRAYVLIARLALALNQVDQASSSLETTLALNPAHQLAQKLLVRVRESVR